MWSGHIGSISTPERSNSAQPRTTAKREGRGHQGDLSIWWIDPILTISIIVISLVGVLFSHL
jgi:hypothetical protein